LIGFIKALFNKISFARLSDEDLVKKYLSTSKQKYFDLLYQRHSNKVYGKCLSMLNNRTLCKDALQDIFLKILLNISNFNFNSKFSTWIYSITYNHCIDVIRKEGKLISNEKDIEEDHKLITEVDEIEEKMLLQIKVKRLEEILDSIPVSDKAILLLKYQGGMSIKEISDILAKSESAVKMKLKRAKEKCLKKYSELYNNQPI